MRALAFSPAKKSTLYLRTVMSAVILIDNPSLLE
jgi:hypothetical protein